MASYSSNVALPSIIVAYIFATIIEKTCCRSKFFVLWSVYNYLAPFHINLSHINLGSRKYNAAKNL